MQSLLEAFPGAEITGVRQLRIEAAAVAGEADDQDD